jgi:hypothetical protein
MLWQRKRNRLKIDSCVWQRDDFDSECYASEKDKSELTAVTHENAGMIDPFIDMINFIYKQMSKCYTCVTQKESPSPESCLQTWTNVRMHFVHFRQCVSCCKCTED